MGPSFFNRLGTSPWVRFTLVLLIVFGLRFHTIDQVVIDWDESVYLVVAKDLMEGGTLYHTVWDHKGPLLYGVLMPVAALADGSLVPVRLFATAWLLLTMLFIELICRRLVRPERAFVGPLIYGLFFSVPEFGGLAANAELFMMLPATIAIWAVVRWLGGDRRRGWLAAAGVASAAAILIKPTAAFTILVLPLVVAADRFDSSPRRWRDLLIDAAVFASAAAAVFATCAIAFAVKGTFGELVFATLTFNRHYVAGTPLLEAWNEQAAFFGWAVMGDPFTMLAVGCAVMLLLSWRRDPVSATQRVLVGGLVVCSLIGVSLGRNLYFHYYLQMALPIGLIIALAFGRLRIGATHLRWLSCAFLVMGCLSAFSPHRSDPEHRSRNPMQDRDLQAVSAYIAENTGEHDEIFVLGGEPVIHYLSGRSAPTRYFFWQFHADRWNAILNSRQETLERFRSDPPLFFLFSQHEVRVPVLERYMFEHYDLVAEIGGYQIGRRRGADAGPTRALDSL